MEETIDTPKLSVQDFAAKIKAKYPEYKDIPDDELANKIIAKHPEYESQVDMEKKSPSQTTSPDIGTPSQDGGTITSQSSSISPSSLNGVERAQQSIERRRQLLEQGYSDIVQKESVYQNPVNQEKLKGKLYGISGIVKNIADYSIENLKNIYSAGKEALSTPTPETAGQFVLNSMRQEKEGKKNIIGAYGSSLQGSVEATKQSAKNLAISLVSNPPVTSGEQAKSLLSATKLGSDVAITGALATPEGAAFVGSLEALKAAGVPDETVRTAMSAASTVGNKMGVLNENSPTYIKDLFGMLDLGIMGGVMYYSPKTLGFLKDKIPFPEMPKDVQDNITESLPKVTPNDVQAAITHPDNIDLAKKEKEILDTHNDLQKVSDEAKPAIANNLNQLEGEKHGLEQQEVQSQINQAHEQTVNDIKSNLEQQSQRTDISEPSKEAIKTMADNLKIGDTVEMDVKPKEKESGKVIIPKQEFNIDFESPVTKEQMSLRVVPDKGDFVSGYNLYQGDKKVGRIGRTELMGKLDNGEYRISESTAERAQPTGEEVVPRETPSYRTAQFGSMEGQPMTDSNRGRQKEWMKDGDITMSGKENDGETAKQFEQRVLPEWEKTKTEPNNTTVVTHSSVLKSIKTWESPDTWKGDKPKDANPQTWTPEQWKDFSTAYNKESTENGDLETFKGTNGDIHVIRHGETEDNQANKFRSGNTNLTKQGRQEGAQAGQKLKEKTGGEKPKIITSDLPRTIETTKIINDQFGEPSGSTGISIKAREQRAVETGTTPTESGQGWTGEQALARGNELLAKSVDPVGMINDDKIPLHDKVAIAQAQANKLGKETNAAGDKYGVNSNEYKRTKKAEEEYLKQVKPLSTLSHKAFAAHQGQVEIDTGSWTGLIRAAEESKGAQLTEAEKQTAKKLAIENKKLQDDKDYLLRLNKLHEAEISELKNRESIPQKRIKAKFDKVADLILKGKVSRPDVFSAATPASLVWDGALEVAAKTTRALGDVAQSIADGLEYIRNSDWYKGIDSAKQKEAEKAFEDFVRGTENKIPSTDEEKYIGRLEKQLSDLESGVVKGEKVKPELSDATKEKVSDLKERIKNKKEELGLIPSKELPKSPLTEEEKRLQLKGELLDAKGKFTAKQAKGVWGIVKQRLDNGEDLGKATYNTSTELGISPDQVRSAIAQPKGGKVLMDSEYMRLRKQREAQIKTKNWVESRGYSIPRKIWDFYNKFTFAETVFGHGGVWITTHSGTLLTQPSQWANLFPTWIKSFKLAYGKESDFAKAVEDHVNDPLYPTALKSGSKIAPDDIASDDYLKGGTVFGKIGRAGNKGFFGAKQLRFKLWKSEYNNLTDAEKADPESLKAIADLTNYATGTINPESTIGRGAVAVAQPALFAAKLIGSVYAGAVKAPLKAAGTGINIVMHTLTKNWKEASMADKVFARVYARTAGEKIAVYMAGLAAAQGVYKLLGSNTKINAPFMNYIGGENDPTKNDYLKFKVGGRTIDWSGGVVPQAEFISQLISEADKATSTEPQKERPQEAMVNTIGKQVRYKLNPAIGIIADAVWGTDAVGRPLPAPYAVKPYAEQIPYANWLEYGASKLPIPLAEGIRVTLEAMRDGGMNKTQALDVWKGIGSTIVSGGTGLKIGYEAKEKEPKRTSRPDVSRSQKRGRT